jgi:hypothetical protein
MFNVLSRALALSGSLALTMTTAGNVNAQRITAVSKRAPIVIGGSFTVQSAIMVTAECRG